MYSMSSHSTSQGMSLLAVAVRERLDRVLRVVRQRHWWYPSAHSGGNPVRPVSRV